MAILETLPICGERWQRKVLALVWRLKAMPALAAADAGDLEAVAVRWHAEAGGALGPEKWAVSAAAVRAEFARAWRGAKHKVGDRPVDDLLALANAEEPPPELPSGHRQPEFLLLAKLCRQLHRDAGDDGFPLSHRMAAELLGVSVKTAGRYMQHLRNSRMLVLVEQGSKTTGLANVYRWVGSSRDEQAAGTR
jgi:hypothetical protein